MKHAVLLLLLPLLALAACLDDTSRLQTPRIGHFKGLPPQLQGCSCYYSASEKELAEETYSFVLDFDSVACIEIDGHMQWLRLISHRPLSGLPEDMDYTEVYSNDSLEVELEVLYDQPSGDETWKNKATLTLRTRTGQSTTMRLVGECGC